MNRLFFFLLLFIPCVAAAQIDKVVPKKPAPEEGLVHDYANIITDDQEQALERKLLAYDDSTSSQITVVTLSTLKDGSLEYEDEEVALKILRDWGIGQQGRNNGIVVLVVKSKDDTEKKIRIEVGYGLEGAIPDMVAASIIDHEMATNFKAGNYYRGLDEGTSALIKAAAGEFKAPEEAAKGFRPRIGTIIFIAILLFILFSGAAGGGGRGGGYVSRRGYRGWWLPTGGGWSGGGWSGGGGGWSGGGGGGFGGFGGGSGGGGGASGSW